MITAINKLFFTGFILFLFSCNTASPKSDAIKKNQEGVSYMNAGNYEKALQAFEEAVTDPQLSQPSKGTIYRNLALTYSELDNKDSAVHYSTLAAKSFTKNSYDYLVNMADVDLLTGKTAKAIERLLRAARIDPDEIAVNNTLGLIYMGEYDDANLDLNTALVFNKKAFEAAKDRVTEDVLARNYYRLEDYDNAELHFDRLFENHPDMVAYPYYAALVKHKLKKTKEADMLFEKVIAMDSSYKESIEIFKVSN